MGAAGRAAAADFLDQLTKITMTPNPLFEDPPIIKEGDRVGFKVRDELLVGVVSSVDTERATGRVRIVLDEDTITSIEVDDA
jgi:hypothetical protein